MIQDILIGRYTIICCITPGYICKSCSMCIHFQITCQVTVNLQPVTISTVIHTLYFQSRDTGIQYINIIKNTPFIFSDGDFTTKTHLLTHDIAPEQFRALTNKTIAENGANHTHTKKLVHKH